VTIVGVAYLTVGCLAGQARDGAFYEPVLQDSEREAVSDLLQYLENVCRLSHYPHTILSLMDYDRGPR
jgi:hypothetical protein